MDYAWEQQQQIMEEIGKQWHANPCATAASLNTIGLGIKLVSLWYVVLLAGFGFSLVGCSCSVDRDAPEGTVPRSKKKDKEIKWNGFFAFFGENVCGACLGKTCRHTRVFWVVTNCSKTAYSVCQDSGNVSLHWLYSPSFSFVLCTCSRLHSLGQKSSQVLLWNIFTI